MTRSLNREIETSIGAKFSNIDKKHSNKGYYRANTKIIRVIISYETSANNTKLSLVQFHKNKRFSVCQIDYETSTYKTRLSLLKVHGKKMHVLVRAE